MTPTPVSIHKRESALAAAMLTLLAFAFLIPSIRGHDGAGNYAYLMSMLRDGDLDFTNDYALLDIRPDPAGHEKYQMNAAPVDPHTRKPANRYGIGAALFWAPAVIPVHFFLERLSPDLATGLTPPYEYAVGVASAFWGGLGVWLLFVWLRERFGARAVWGAAAGILLATPLGFYTWAHGSMSHAVSFFIASMAMLTLDRLLCEPRAIHALFLGLWAGLLAVTRVQDISWSLTLFAATLLGSSGESNRPPLRRARAPIMFLIAFLLALLPQLAVWKLLYGSWLAGPSPYLNREGGALAPWPRHLWQTLASSRHGAFAWHPVLIVGIVGLIHLARNRRGVSQAADLLDRRLALIGLAGLGLQTYLVASWSMWWAGASFGNRFFISSYPYLALGLTYVLSLKLKRFPARAGLLLIGALILWNAGLLIQYGSGMISREEAPEWGRIITNQFTEVPRWIFQKLGG